MQYSFVDADLRLKELQPIQNKVGLILGLPMGRKNVRREWAHAMMTMGWPMGVTIMHSLVLDSPVAEAREYICEQAHLVGAKYVWFVDDDTVPPSVAIRQLTYQLDQNPDAAAIGGIYVSRYGLPEPIVFRGYGEGVFWDWAVGDVFEVDMIGTGCFLLRTSALNDIPKPWFRTVDVAVEGALEDRGLDRIGTIQNTDDMYFCKKLRAAGKKILAHGGVLCKHWNMDTGEVSELPKDSRPYLLKAARDAAKAAQ